MLAGLPRGQGCGPEVPGVPSAPVDDGVLAHLRRKRIDSLYYLASDPTCPRQLLYDRVWSIQRSALCELLRAFSAGAGGALVVLKGAERLESCFAPHAIGYMIDCDVLVRREALAEAQAALYSQGYRPLIFDEEAGEHRPRDVADLANIEATHYQLAPLVRVSRMRLDGPDRAIAAERGRDPLRCSPEGDAVVAVRFDVHHALAADVDAQEFLERSVPGPFGHGERVLEPSDNLWLLACRYYTEVALHGKRELRTLAYIVSVLRQHAGSIDWGRVEHLCGEFETRAPLYYILAFCRSFAPELVPESVVSQLAPTLGSRMRDWGWQIGVLFDFVEPCPRVV